MATNFYRCPQHGKRLIDFRAGHPPKVCGKNECGLPLEFVPSPVAVGGGITVWKAMNDLDYTNAELQLGERPRDRAHLRHLEKKTGAMRVD